MSLSFTAYRCKVKRGGLSGCRVCWLTVTYLRNAVLLSAYLVYVLGLLFGFDC